MNTERAELIVVGAGPAGLCAAIEAARAGLDVVVVDENPSVGGQIFRQLPEAFRAPDVESLSKDFQRGQALFRELEGLPIRFLNNTLVWGVFENRVLELVQGHRSWRLEGQALVIAAGAYDRPVPIPGWTLPGVLTVGGAQTILKSQRILPGKRILMAGTGPLLLVVASQLAKAGAEIVAVAEAVPARALLPHVRGMLSAWSITRDGIGYRWSLLRSRVPWIAPSILTRIEGDQEVERATIARVDENWRPVADTEETFEVDTVCIGYGLVPSIELPRLCGCAIRYDAVADVWVLERNAEFETSVPGIFAVGDGAGVAGAVVAAAEGRIAGATVARRLKGEALPGGTERIDEARRHLARLARFRTAMDRVYRIRPGLHELATQETTICRCEEVRLGELDVAMEDGANSLNQLKAWTRAGMGPCQARMCGLPTAHLLARRTGAPVAELGGYTSRPPVKPVSVNALISER